jgi:hypothetical protein
MGVQRAKPLEPRKKTAFMFEEFATIWQNVSRL